MTNKNQATPEDFLITLQREASLQSKLSSTRLLPPQLDMLTSLIGRYPWQAVAIVSFVGALVTEVLRWEVLR